MVTRNDVIVELMDQIRTVNSARYQAHRGAIEWRRWPFATKPYAIAVTIERSQISRSIINPDGMVHDTMTMILDVAVRAAPPATASGKTWAISDSEIDTIHADLESNVTGLMQAQNGDGDHLITRVHPDDEASEWHDVEAELQGVLFTFTVDF